MGCCPISAAISSRSRCASAPATDTDGIELARASSGSNFPFWGEGGKVRNRRTPVVAAHSGEGPLTEQKAAAHPWRRELVFMPRSCPLRAASRDPFAPGASGHSTKRKAFQNPVIE